MNKNYIIAANVYFLTAVPILVIANPVSSVLTMYFNMTSLVTASADS